MSGEALAEAAVAFAGTRFRLHGRDPETGLDCIGLLAAALTRIGRVSETAFGWHSTPPPLRIVVEPTLPGHRGLAADPTGPRHLGLRHATRQHAHATPPAGLQLFQVALVPFRRHGVAPSIVLLG